MSQSLNGRVALVTGGSRGVGRGIALRLAAEGAAVAVNYRRDAEAAEEVVEEITAKRGRAVAYRASVSDASAVETMVAGIEVDMGVVDLLVSNAGLASRGSLVADTGREEYLRLLDVHLLGPLALVRRLLPGMRAADRADVVVISSTTTGELPKGGAAYSLAKSAMETAALTLAREERDHGVRVNIVAPGLVATDMGERLVKSTGESMADVEAQYPFGRVARPADVAGVVSFLASQDGEYLTGQRIEVDGGGPDKSIFR